MFALILPIAYISWYIIKTRKHGEAIWFSEILTRIVASLAIGAIVVTSTWVLYGQFATNGNVRTTSHISIVALKDKVDTEGSFFLGTGTIKGEAKYVYMAQTPHGLHTKTLPADRVYINYVGDNQTPYIQVWRMSCPNAFLRNMFILYSDFYYTINVPYGSVTENIYEIDLE